MKSEENNAVRLPSDLIQVLSYTIAEMESGKFCHLHWVVAMEKIEEHPAWYRDLPSAEDIFDIAEYITTTYRSHVISSMIQKLQEAGIDMEGLEGEIYGGNKQGVSKNLYESKNVGDEIQATFTKEWHADGEETYTIKLK